VKVSPLRSLACYAAVLEPCFLDSLRQQLNVSVICRAVERSWDRQLIGRDVITTTGRETRIPRLMYKYRVSEQGAQGQYYYLYQSVGLLSSLRLRPTAAPSHYPLTQQPRSSQACDLGTSSDSIRTCVIFRTRATCNIVNSTRCAKGSGRALTR
jgi:hypothetical protein